MASSMKTRGFGQLLTFDCDKLVDELTWSGSPALVCCEQVAD